MVKATFCVALSVRNFSKAFVEKFGLSVYFETCNINKHGKEKKLTFSGCYFLVTSKHIFQLDVSNTKLMAYIIMQNPLKKLLSKLRDENEKNSQSRFQDLGIKVAAETEKLRQLLAMFETMNESIDERAIRQGYKRQSYAWLGQVSVI